MRLSKLSRLTAELALEIKPKYLGKLKFQCHQLNEAQKDEATSLITLFTTLKSKSRNSDEYLITLERLFSNVEHFETFQDTIQEFRRANPDLDDQEVQVPRQRRYRKTDEQKFLFRKMLTRISGLMKREKLEIMVALSPLPRGCKETLREGYKLFEELRQCGFIGENDTELLEDFFDVLKMPDATELLDDYKQEIQGQQAPPPFNPGYQPPPTSFRSSPLPSTPLSVSASPTFNRPVSQTPIPPSLNTPLDKSYPHPNLHDPRKRSPVTGLNEFAPPPAKRMAREPTWQAPRSKYSTPSDPNPVISQSSQSWSTPFSSHSSCQSTSSVPKVWQMQPREVQQEQSFSQSAVVPGIQGGQNEPLSAYPSLPINWQPSSGQQPTAPPINNYPTSSHHLQATSYGGAQEESGQGPSKLVGVGQHSIRIDKLASSSVNAIYEEKKRPVGASCAVPQAASPSPSKQRASITHNLNIKESHDKQSGQYMLPGIGSTQRAVILSGEIGRISHLRANQTARPDPPVAPSSSNIIYSREMHRVEHSPSPPPDAESTPFQTASLYPSISHRENDSNSDYESAEEREDEEERKEEEGASEAPLTAGSKGVEPKLEEAVECSEGNKPGKAKLVGQKLSQLLSYVSGFMSSSSS